ncbi:hypothetical protein [Nocardia sp. CY41]|uniref:hypothetical protein n=1 Tax=Nocardia sp. CY41 TaxID=2608686 RepID=UPI00135B4A76|nr:hypothetical protein [Nocardia sp. CY41]
MPKNKPTAAQRARRLKIETGGVYTELLHAQTTPVASTTARAGRWLNSILTHLRDLGWPAAALDLDDSRYVAYCGPVQLEVELENDDIDMCRITTDLDTASQPAAPLYLGVLAPADATVEDLATGARADTETPSEIAVRVDAELTATRRKRVLAAQDEPGEPCPICGDRYPTHHLLATSPEGPPVCPACAWDGDHYYRADLPYLAVQIDQLVDMDLSAPAGWAAVAAVLALTCGPDLGRRVERELTQRRGWPVIMDRWDRPMDRSWIWLAPHPTRHPAFAQLGAGASLEAITRALERYDPSLPVRAQQVCREAGVRWRAALWPAAAVYAVAFTTQALERDRHRTPVHVVDSLSDGLSQIRPPFAVTGDALNVESGLEELLEHLLFPLLLGHGLYDQPHLLPREHQHEQITDTQLPQAVETVDNSSALGPIVRDISGGAAAEADRPGDTTSS